jgi:FkbM family methyltransferase
MRSTRVLLQDAGRYTHNILTNHRRSTPLISTLSRIFEVLQFAVDGDHPRRKEIANAYARFHLRKVLAKASGRSLRSFELLGSQIHFVDPGAFQFLLSEIFIDGAYKHCRQKPATVLDCGSNIGMSILYFKTLWPETKITGVEASPDTFVLLRKNVEGMSDVRLVNAAVCDRHGTMAFYPSSPNSMTGSTNAIRSGGEATMVRTIPLSDLITEPIDLLKIDIEGSETAAFTELEQSGRIRMIREMLIEYHYNLPGENHSLTDFLDRLTRCGFGYEVSGNLPDTFGECHDMFIWARRREDAA